VVSTALRRSLAGTVTIDLISWGARTYDQPLLSRHVEYEVAALGSKVVKTLPLKPHLTNESLTLMDAVVRLKTTAKGNPRGGTLPPPPPHTHTHTPYAIPSSRSSLHLRHYQHHPHHHGRGGPAEDHLQRQWRG